MKKIYLSLAGLVICGSVISQNAFNAQTLPKHIGIMSAHSKAPVSNPNQNRTAGAFRLWTEPIGDIMTNKGLNCTPGNANADETTFVDMIFQDSTVKSSSQSGDSFIRSILLGSVLDPKSTLLQANNLPIVTKNDSYNIDSLMILGSYVKKTSSTDTLYIWLVWGDTANTSVFAKRLDNATWNAPIGTWRRSVIGPKVTGAAGAAGNKVKAAAPSSNMMLIKYALQNTDSVGGGGYIQYIAVPLLSPVTIPAGNIVSCFYTFVPGGAYTPGAISYNLGGSSPQTINGFAAGVWGQLNPAIAALTDYQDQQVDATSWCMGASYDKSQRHNLYPTTWSTFMPGDLTTAPVIAYSIYGNSTVGIKEITDNNTFKMSQNIPNPATGNTIINYELVQSANVAFEIADVTGKKVMSVEKGKQSIGKYSIDFDTNQLQSGIYFYTLKAGDSQITKKMSIVK